MQLYSISTSKTVWLSLRENNSLNVCTANLHLNRESLQIRMCPAFLLSPPSFDRILCARYVPNLQPYCTRTTRKSYRCRPHAIYLNPISFWLSQFQILSSVRLNAIDNGNEQIKRTIPTFLPLLHLFGHVLLNNFSEVRTLKRKVFLSSGRLATTVIWAIWELCLIRSCPFSLYGYVCSSCAFGA